MAQIKRINRNNSWDDGFQIEKDEIVYLDVSMPKGCFHIGPIWWNFQDFVQDYFPANYSYARMSDGCYDKLEVIGTCEEIEMIYGLFIERYKNRTSFYFKHFFRYVNTYFKRVGTGNNVQCLEAYLKSNMSGWR